MLGMGLDRFVKKKFTSFSSFNHTHTQSNMALQSGKKAVNFQLLQGLKITININKRIDSDPGSLRFGIYPR